MKKKIWLLFTLVTILGLWMAGCGKEQEDTNMFPIEWKNIYLLNNENTYTESIDKENEHTYVESTDKENANTDAESIDKENTDTENTDTESIDIENTDTENLEEIPVIEEKKAVTIAFTGDVLFSDGVLANYDAKGLEGILDRNLIDELNNADITVINNEFPFSERGTQAEDKQYTFRVSPERVHILQEMGVDAATLANNHTLDFGVDAMLDTIDTLKGADIIPLGAGNNSTEAKQIAYIEKEEMTFAFLGASRVIPVPEWTAGKNPGLLTTYDPTMLLEQIKEAENNADVVIVYVHWGLERENYPEDYQRNLGQMYIDAGADLVVGSHSHCLQGIEYYNDAPIVYSLGNFVFGSQIPSTALLKMTFEEDKEPLLSVVPAKGANFYTSTITEESQLEEFYSFYEEISFGVGFEDGVVVRH